MSKTVRINNEGEKALLKIYKRRRGVDSRSEIVSSALIEYAKRKKTK